MITPHVQERAERAVLEESRGYKLHVYTHQFVHKNEGTADRPKTATVANQLQLAPRLFFTPYKQVWALEFLRTAPDPLVPLPAVCLSVAVCLPLRRPC